MAKKTVSGSLETKDSINIFSDPRRHTAGTESSESFIFLVLDCYSYIAGEKVTGEILLNISENIPKSCLKFQARGTEEINVFDSHDRTKIIAHEIQEIYSLDTVLLEWETGLLIGQHVFPFNFKLPNYCPSTFYYSGEDECKNYIKAEVFYHVCAKLFIPGSESNLTHSRIINIKNAFSLERPNPSIEVSPTVFGCCCSNKGSTNFRLCIDHKEHCIVDGEVKYKLYPDNANCKAPINRVVGNIILEFTILSKKKEFKIIKNLSETTRAAWIGSFSSLMYEKDFEYITDLKVNSEELNPSSNRTPLIICNYCVEMCVFYDIRFMKNPIVIRLPFHVNPKATYRREEPKLPSQWDPIESSIFNLIVETRRVISNSEDSMLIPTPIN